MNEVSDNIEMSGEETASIKEQFRTMQEQLNKMTQEMTILIQASNKTSEENERLKEIVQQNEKDLQQAVEKARAAEKLVKPVLKTEGIVLKEYSNAQVAEANNTCLKEDSLDKNWVKPIAKLHERLWPKGFHNKSYGDFKNFEDHIFTVLDSSDEKIKFVLANDPRVSTLYEEAKDLKVLQTVCWSHADVVR